MTTTTKAEMGENKMGAKTSLYTVHMYVSIDANSTVLITGKFNKS